MNSGAVALPSRNGHHRADVTFPSLAQRASSAVDPALAGLADQFPWPVFLLDGTGRVMHSNPAGTTLLTTGGELATHQDRLQAVDPADGPALRDAIDRVRRHADCGTPQGAIAWLGQARARRALLVSIVTLAAERAGDRADLGARLAVHVRRLDKPEPDREIRLQQLFKLSPAEAVLAGGLLRGLSLVEIAEQRRVKGATVRAQLQSLFAKTSTQRQSHLLMVMMRGSELPYANA